MKIKDPNPAIAKAFDKSRREAGQGTGTMEINSTVNKTGFLLLLLIITAFFTWTNANQAMGLMITGLFSGLIFAFVTIFKPQWAGITSPVYAVCEGLFLGGISAIFEAQYPGIVQNAALLTFGVLFMMLFLYRAGIIKATEKFKMGVASATGAIALIYFASIIAGFFGMRIPFLHSSGPIGIGISLVIITVAALNLIIDFDFIERGAKAGAPKYMEWYGAFGLLVTLVWLYLEILRLLSLLSRD